MNRCTEEEPPCFQRSGCPVAVTLDLLGDRWTLLVIRDLMMGKRRYAQFLESPERIATNILSDRLKKLEEGGLVARHCYRERPKRYEYQLTNAGADTLPILQAVVQWAARHVPGTWTPPARFHSLKPEELYSETGQARAPSE